MKIKSQIEERITEVRDSLVEHQALVRVHEAHAERLEEELQFLSFAMLGLETSVETPVEETLNPKALTQPKAKGRK